MNTHTHQPIPLLSYPGECLNGIHTVDLLIL